MGRSVEIDTRRLIKPCHFADDAATEDFLSPEPPEPLEPLEPPEPPEPPEPESEPDPFDEPEDSEDLPLSDFADEPSADEPSEDEPFGPPSLPAATVLDPRLSVR